MIKKCVIALFLGTIAFIVCGMKQDSNLVSAPDELSIIESEEILKFRRKVGVKDYSKCVSDSRMDDRTLKFLYKLYQLPSKNKIYFSIAGCFGIKANPLYKKTEKGYIPLDLKETPALNCVYTEITGRKPRLNGVELTYALDEYWSLFTNETVPSGPDINGKYYSYLVSCIRKAFNDFGSIPVITYHIANPYSPLPPTRYGAYAEYKDKKHENVVAEMRLRTGDRCGFRGENENPRAFLDEKLDDLAGFIIQLKDKRGYPIPCIIRLFHEMDMNSFWWGVSCCSPEDYQWLYRYSVDFIREKVGTHNLIWGYSLGNRFTEYEAMMERYPGDNYVDIIGGDEYNIGANMAVTNSSVKRCILITRESLKRNKVGGLFECGISRFEGSDQLKNDAYYTQHLPDLLKREDIYLSFVLGYDGSFSIPTTTIGEKNLRSFVRSKNISR